MERYEREKLPFSKIVKLHANKRTCKICNSNNVEDEKHFLLECPYYIQERNELLTVVNTNIGIPGNNCNLEQFKIIMSCNETEIIKALGKYIFKCFKKRTELVTVNCT